MQETERAWKVCLNDRTISALEDLKIVTAVKGCWGASSLMTGDMTGDSVKLNRKERRVKRGRLDSLAFVVYIFIPKDLKAC